MQIERKTPINHSGNDRVLGEPAEGTKGARDAHM